MWRSQARAILFRSSIPKAPSAKTQVLSKTLSRPIFSPSPHSWTWLSQAVPIYQNPRFFSHSPQPIDATPDKEAHLDSINKDVFGENPSFISQESDASSSPIFDDAFGKHDSLDQNSDPISSQSSDSSVIFDGLAEKEDTFGRNPDFVSEESHDFSENLNLISEESVGGIDSIDVDGESPTSFGKGNGDGGDLTSSFASEDAAEEKESEVPEVDMEQVENVLSLLQSSLAEPLESSLDKLDFNINEEFVVRVLQTPEVLGKNLIEFFRWAWKKPDFSVSVRVVECIFSTIGIKRRQKEVYSLWDLVKEIGETEKGLLNTDILNKLIFMLWKLGKGKASLEVFSKFDEFGCKHDSESYYMTVEALLNRSMLDAAWSVCEKMLNSGSLPDEEKIGKIIAGLCKGSKAKDAHLVYIMAKENKKYPPKNRLSFLISKLSADNETVHLAAELLEDFYGESGKHAIKQFSAVIGGLCRINDVNEAKKLLFKMIDAGPPPGNTVFNFLITALSKAGEMDEAITLMRLMETRGLRPDVYTYSVVMSGYANGGQMDDACRILSEAKKIHSKLSRVTYHTLIRGYCKIEEFDKALKCIGEMQESGLQPNVDEYSKLIQSLCLKALDWQTAEKLLEEMKESGLHLNGITRALISAVKELVEEELPTEVVSVAA